MAESASFVILDGLRDALVARLNDIGRADLASRFGTAIDRNARLDQAINLLSTLEGECWAEYQAQWDQFWPEIGEDVWVRLRQRFPNLDQHLATLYADPDPRVKQILKLVVRAIGMAVLRWRQAQG